MNDQEFIELLNLYIDHEIGAEEASRLETEVMGNPNRRKIYDQYCRMQKACLTLARTTDAFASKPASAAARISPFRAWAGRLYGGSLVAAAACVAIALIVRQSQSGHPTAVVHPSLEESPGLAQRPPTPALQSVVYLKPVLSDQPKPILIETEQAPHLNWIGQIHVAPVQQFQTADLLFTNKPADLKPADRLIRAPQSIEESVEMTAFTFQK